MKLNFWKKGMRSDAADGLYFIFYRKAVAGRNLSSIIYYLIFSECPILSLLVSRYFLLWVLD